MGICSITQKNSLIYPYAGMNTKAFRPLSDDASASVAYLRGRPKEPGAATDSDLSERTTKLADWQRRDARRCTVCISEHFGKMSTVACGREKEIYLQKGLPVAEHNSRS